MQMFYRHYSLFLATMATGMVLGASISELEANNLIERHLENAGNTYFQYDLSKFSLRFDRCQYVKMYDDELAEDEESDSPLATRHFVVFRLCPSDECETCSEIFGRYVSEAESYLAATVEEQQEALAYVCNNCQESCNDDEEYCIECGNLCYDYQNFEANGYIDAADYIECQELEMNNDDGNDDGENDNGENNDSNDELQLYIGPRCSQDGNRILIGLFYDDECLDPYTLAKPEDYLGAEFSYHSLAHTYKNDGSYCLSCKESEENYNEQDGQDADDVNEMCEEVYSSAAKCESEYGLGGFIQTMNEDYDYDNQVENESMVCNFIESLLWDSYTETGEINLDGDSEVILRETTGLQKVAVSLLALSIIGLLTLGNYTQKIIAKSLSKVELASRGNGQLA